MASIIKRKKNYSVVYNYVDENGETKQKWETWHTHKEALKRKAEIENQQHTGTFLPPSNQTITEFLYDFVSLYGEKKWGVSMYDSQTALIANYINPIIGDMEVQAVTPRAVDGYIQTLQKTKSVSTKTRKAVTTYVSDKTIEKIIKLLRCAFKQAVRWEIIARNPFDNVILPKTEYAKRDIWTADMIRLALDKCTDSKLYVAMNLSFACSLRMGEILGLTRGRRRKMTVNGVAAKNGGDLSQVLHTVFFSPEDLFLIREGAAARRRFMDMSLCQLRPRYAEALAEYGRLYEHKTRILRDSDEYPQLLDTLPDFNRRLCQVGAVLISYRARYVQALAVHAQRAHWECSGEREELALSYQTVKTVEDPLGPAADIAAALAEHQAQHHQAELASRLCLSGPHKDDIAVTVNGLEARHFCSQGQVRTAALSLKLADREIHKTAIGEYPVMLLDDVLSELDPRRQEYVLNRIAGGQVFITCCENDRLDALLSGRVYHVREGKVL